MVAGSRAPYAPIPRPHAGRDETIAFRRPVAHVQENGNNDVNWLKVTVDPKSPEVFSYQPQIVPGNRTAVPAP